MKKIRLTLLFIITSLLYTNAQNFSWVQGAGSTSTANTSSGASIGRDASGNVYTIGSFNGTITIGTYTLTSAGGFDVFISKMDASGTVLWAKSMGSTGSDVGASITADASGNVYVTGRFSGTVAFGTYTLVSSGSIPAFICKLNTSGTVLWAKSISGTGGTSVYSTRIAADASGNVFVGGIFLGGSATFGTYTLASSGSIDGFVCKLDASGTVLWAKNMGTASSSSNVGVTTDASGNVYVTGVFSGTATLGTYTLTSAGSNLDVFVGKMDASGTVLWANRMGGTSDDYCGDIVADASGNIYVMGSFSATATFGTYTLTSVSVNGRDVFVCKLNATTGTVLWAKTMSTTGSASIYSYGIATDASGNVYFTGQLANPGTITFFGTYTLTMAGGTAVFVSKIDALGTVFWAQSIGASSSNNRGEGITADASGNVYVTGIFNGTVDFDPGAGTTSLTTSANTSLFVLKLCAPPTMGVSGGNICAGQTVTLSATGAPSYTWLPSNTTGSQVVVSPIVTTVYTVAGTGTAGCTGSATSTVIVNALPTVTVTPTNTAICIGKTTTLTAGTAASYVWNPGGLTTTSIVVSPASNTSYTVTGTSAAGCTASATSTITVNALPTVTVTPASTAICIGSSATLTAGTAASYLWNPGGLTTTSIVVSPASNTSYTVTGTSAAGCTASATGTITVNALPAVTITPTGQAICLGNSATLTAGTANSYLWNPGGLTTTSIVVSPAVTTSYTLIGTSAAGCTTSTTGTITVNALPTVTVTPTSATICAGNSATLTGGTANSYLWNPGGLTTTSIVVSPLISTSYTVVGTSVAGCTASASGTVIVNALPTVTITPTSTAICIGSSATLTTGTAASYLWNPGGLTTTSIVVSPASNTSYTVVGTSAAGCTASATGTVTVNALPTVTITPSNTVICSGISTTLNAGGAASYLWNPGALTTTNIVVSPISNTNYTVTGTSAQGCTNIAVQSISVNPSPTVLLTPGSQTLCSGIIATLTPSGANNYTLNPGNISGTSFTVSPVVTTQYSLTGINAANCINPIPVIATVVINPLTTISGQVTSTVGAVSGSVTLYRFVSFFTQFDSITSVAINGTGGYNFNSVGASSYVVLALPTASNMIGTYGTSSSGWQGATVISHSCINNSTQNIDVIDLPPANGPGSLSGTIYEGFGFGHRSSGITGPGNPIIGITVKGGNSNGRVVGTSTTNTSGKYSITGLPANNPGESYFILVDIPGLDTNNTYIRVIVTGSENYDHLDFMVDSAKITPALFDVGIKEMNIENGKLLVYPNPTDNRLNVEFELKQSSELSVELMDIHGRTIKTLLSKTYQGKGNVTVLSQLNEIKPGIYFLKIKIGDEERTTKLIVAD